MSRPDAGLALRKTNTLCTTPQGLLGLLFEEHLSEGCWVGPTASVQVVAEAGLSLRALLPAVLAEIWAEGCAEVGLHFPR